jgi:uncharacterized repeat protein (TIGR03943 family)
VRNAGGSVLLFVVGAVVLRLVVVGDFVNFVKPGHRLWLLTAGVGLVVVGLYGVIVTARHPEADHDRPRERSPHTHGPLAAPPEVLDEYRLQHELDHSQVPGVAWRGVAWLLMIPVMLVLVVPPPALGAFAAGRAGADTPKPAATAHFDPLPASDPAALMIYDYAQRTVWDQGRGLIGRTVELSGFVTPRPAGGWYLTRLRITCCAADARAYLVWAVGARRDYPANTWVKVTGTALTPNPGTRVARVDAARVEIINTPAETYEQ